MVRCSISGASVLNGADEDELSCTHVREDCEELARLTRCSYHANLTSSTAIYPRVHP